MRQGVLGLARHLWAGSSSSSSVRLSTIASTYSSCAILGLLKAGSFAFVSPIIAGVVGVIAAGETVSGLSVAGMAVMLLAAGACLYGDELESLFARIARNGTGVVQKNCSSCTLMR
jgi:drug/metabolite transporter (DMT)-like permease